MKLFNLSAVDKFLIKTTCRETYHLYFCPKHKTIFTIKKSDVRKPRCTEDYCKHEPIIYQED